MTTLLVTPQFSHWVKVRLLGDFGVCLYLGWTGQITLTLLMVKITVCRKSMTTVVSHACDACFISEMTSLQKVYHPCGDSVMSYWRMWVVTEFTWADESMQQARDWGRKEDFSVTFNTNTEWVYQLCIIIPLFLHTCIREWSAKKQAYANVLISGRVTYWGWSHKLWKWNVFVS